jgi:hypothetical protein
MAIPNLLFVDANIWLDFYRVRNDTGLRLLKHTEALADKLIVTYQLDNEYKRNRQAAIVEGTRNGELFLQFVGEILGGSVQTLGTTDDGAGIAVGIEWSFHKLLSCPLNS